MSSSALQVAKTATYLPDLVEVQRASFKWFLEKGLIEELQNFSPISDYTGKLELHFIGEEYRLKRPRHDVEEAKRRDATFASQMYVTCRLINKETGEIKEQEVFIGELPLMTERGTFIINGAERVIVNQIVRSPGVYFKDELDKNGRRTYNASVIPNRGAWLKFETDKNNLLYVRVDKTRKINAHVLMRAMGLSDNDVVDKLRHPEFYQNSIESANDEGINSEDQALLELYKKLRPGEPPSVSGGQQLLHSRFFDPKRYDLGRVGRYKINKKLRLTVPDHVRTLTHEDVLSTIDYLINLEFKERMTVGETDSLTPAQLVNPKPLVAAIKEFFGSSQLSQFMDQTNPLAELTHKRRISALGPGGLTRERAGFAVRDIHPSHYGRLCPIETPEGPNAGLINSLATHARVNEYGFIETPFWEVNNGKVNKEGNPVYLSADLEDECRVAPGDVATDKDGNIIANLIPVRYRQDFEKVPPHQVDYVQLSPVQVISVATSLIPFLEHDDANRALMGSNMQRQAVPLLRPERPLVGTGLESQVARDSGMVPITKVNGTVSYVDANEIVVKDEHGNEHFHYLQKYQRSNQDTCLIAYMPWEGYNYEDAILVSERMVTDDLYTSVHIEKYEIEARQTKLGPEEITREIPNISEESLNNLDEMGIIRIGAFVESGDILVGKVTPKGESDQPPEEKLLRAIFGEKARDVRDNSLRVPKTEKGRVLDVRIYTREQGDELPPGANMVVRVYVAQRRKIQVGDKMAGRHGNKGIISRILPREDMPYLPDGTPVDIVLNPLGVPSRMNVGQVFELLMGWAASNLNCRVKVVPFDEMYGAEKSHQTVQAFLEEASKQPGKAWVYNPEDPGKLLLKDGRTGEPFDQPVAVGYSHFLKLVHLVDDKIHARSTGKPIPRPGTPESFKVLMRELQSLGLDIGVYTDEGKEVDLMQDINPRRNTPSRPTYESLGTSEYEED